VILYLIYIPIYFFHHNNKGRSVSPSSACVFVVSSLISSIVRFPRTICGIVRFLACGSLEGRGNNSGSDRVYAFLAVRFITLAIRFLYETREIQTRSRILAAYTYESSRSRQLNHGLPSMDFNGFRRLTVAVDRVFQPPVASSSAPSAGHLYQHACRVRLSVYAGVAG
jgi:hypothetical protein